MKSVSFSFAILLLFLAQQSLSHPFPPNDVVGDTCRSMPYPDFCDSTLRSDPKSASVKGSMQLGVILVDHIDSKAKATLPKISTLISMSKDHKLKKALKYCHDLYRTIVVGDVSTSKGALTSWNPKFAEEAMIDAANSMNWCNEEFKGLENPLRSENDFVHKAAHIVAAIARIMERGG